MREALRLARKGRGTTSPNPMVGAVLVREGLVLGRGWHRRAGLPHAEIEALQDAVRRGQNAKGATLYVTLEPCSTHGRTPPCTEALIQAGVGQVVVGATDPNPRHRGRGYRALARAGIQVTKGVLAASCAELNEAFNHWVVHRRPLVTVKAAMTLDGKIATAAGESKWITGPGARAFGQRLRREADAILTGINTVLADDPSLTFRGGGKGKPGGLRRIILDSRARTPLTSRLVTDEQAALTTVVVSRAAPAGRVRALARRVQVLLAPAGRRGRGHAGIDLRWLLKRLGAENVTSLLVEGGGEVNASFLLGRLAQRVAFAYAPRVLGGRSARKAVAGEGAGDGREVLELGELRWRRAGPDLLLNARVL